MNKHISKWLLYYPITLLRGEPVLKLEKEFKQREKWTSEKLEHYQLTRLREILNFASNYSPFYSCYIKAKDVKQMSLNEIKSYMHSLPTINKDILIEHQDKIKSSKYFRHSRKTTGGSTGHPVTLIKNSMALAYERAATWRAYSWAGVEIGDKQARFWGVPHSFKGKLLAFFTDVASNRKRFSAFDLQDESLKSVYEGLKKFKPNYLYGYVSAIVSLSNFITTNQLRPIHSIKSIITTSEVLTEFSRSVIQKAFKVRVFNEYGCGEVGSIAHECEYGAMHITSDNLYVESSGNGLIITDLNNKSMPLLRYEIGDFGELDNTKCSCNRPFIKLKNIFGRAYDLIKTPEGKIMHPESVMYIFEELQSKNNAFKQFKIIQEDKYHFKLLVIENGENRESIVKEIEEQFHKKISKLAKIEVLFVPHIEREKSGKMRVVESRVTI